MPRLARAVLTAVAILHPLAGQEIRWTVFLRGAGPVRIGMPLAEVRRKLSDPSARLQANNPKELPGSCAYLVSKRIPQGMSIMFAEGTVVRIDVSKPGIRTAKGAAVGDSEKRIERLYANRIKVERHHYEPQGHYLVYTPPDKTDNGYSMVFETNGTSVTSFRSGTVAATSLVEGCS